MTARASLRVALGLVVAASCRGGSAESAPVAADQAAPVSAPAQVADAGPAHRPAARPKAAPAKVAPLDESMATPYFATGPGAGAAERFGLEDWAGARALYARAHRAAKRRADRARAGLMMGLCDAHLQHWKAAADEIAAAAPALPVLADWLRYQEARARYFAHDLPRAERLAMKVAPDSIVGADAQMLVGDVQRAHGTPGNIARIYRVYLQQHPRGPRLAEARYHLAEALEKLGPKVRAQMIDTYRRIGIDDPTSAWADRAAKRLAALKVTPAPLTGPELMTRGEAYFDAMRNPESEADYAAALASSDLSPAQRCDAAYHRAQSLFKARKRDLAAPRFDEAVAACKAAGDKDLAVRSAYQGGRALAYSRDHAGAVTHYEEAERLDPTNTIADDARLRQAEEWADLGDDAKVTATLSSLPKDYPQGDMRAEAMWRLGWRAWHANDLPGAIGWWQQQIKVMPIDDNYYAEGQAQYWIGRARAVQGDQAAAIASWIDTIRTYPMSYYALLALNRIREISPDRYAKVLADLQKAPPGWDPTQPSFTFKPRPEWASPGFARAMELLRLGLGADAEAELRRLDLTPPPGKHRVEDPDLAEKLWAVAFLYDKAGRYATSHWPTRWHILDYKRQWPVGADRARWQIAYPQAYWELLAAKAKAAGQPVEIQIAIVREESAFEPLMESYANAIGLTQMIFPTARRFAKGTGIKVTRAALRDPEKNVTIGSRFLGYLWDRWKGFAMLVPPSYNAGEHAVDRWLNLRGTEPADAFIEDIVGDQPRNYTKRVLASYFAYSYLYAGKVPVVENPIPKAFLDRAAKDPYAKPH